MKTTEKTLIALSLVLALILGFTLHTSSPQILGAGTALYRNTFYQVNVATTTSVGTTAVMVVASSSFAATPAYLTIDNSGAVGVSCFPVDINGVSGESASGLTYGGGWWLAPNGGTLSLDAVALYGGTIDCLTGSGTTTLGIILR